MALPIETATQVFRQPTSRRSSAPFPAAPPALRDQGVRVVETTGEGVFNNSDPLFLDAVGSITVSAEQRPSARRIAEVRAKIKAADVRCVFHEPQFPTTLIGTIVEGTDVRTGTLDPLGAQLAPGPDAYFELMRNAAGALNRCLAP